MNNFAMASACSPFGLLACKIVEQAILDYRVLMRRGTVDAEHGKAEIRRFLRSQWCDDLLSYTDVNGEWVLHMLEGDAAPPKVVDRHTRKLLTVDGQTAPLHTWCRELGLDSKRFYRMYTNKGKRYVEERLTLMRWERGLC